MVPTNKLPLFIITGASCVGKSSICKILFNHEKSYIVMESDILWNEVYNTPEDGYKTYRELWMKLCYNISQIGLPVVLCGCAIPEQFENSKERDKFSDIHYLAVVCDSNVLEERMVKGRKVTDKNWIKSSIEFNDWLKVNALKTTPPIQLLDTSTITVEESSVYVDNWIMSYLNRYKNDN